MSASAGGSAGRREPAGEERVEVRLYLDALVRTYGGAPHHQTRESVENSFLARSEFPEPPRYRPFDPESAMLHPFDPALFTGGFTASLKTELSASDREFIATLYPPTVSGDAGFGTAPFGTAPFGSPSIKQEPS